MNRFILDRGYTVRVGGLCIVCPTRTFLLHIAADGNAFSLSLSLSFSLSLSSGMKTCGDFIIITRRDDILSFYITDERVD